LKKCVCMNGTRAHFFLLLLNMDRNAVPVQYAQYEI
jgi:hypothetical protein